MRLETQLNLSKTEPLGDGSVYPYQSVLRSELYPTMEGTGHGIQRQLDGQKDSTPSDDAGTAGRAMERDVGSKEGPHRLEPDQLDNRLRIDDEGFAPVPLPSDGTYRKR